MLFVGAPSLFGKKEGGLIETDLVQQLLRSLDSAIEQAKAQSSVERSQIAQVIQKQEDLRRAIATYRQEGSEENRAQLFVDYHRRVSGIYPADPGAPGCVR